MSVATARRLLERQFAAAPNSATTDAVIKALLSAVAALQLRVAALERAMEPGRSPTAEASIAPYKVGALQAPLSEVNHNVTFTGTSRGTWI